VEVKIDPFSKGIGLPVDGLLWRRRSIWLLYVFMILFFKFFFPLLKIIFRNPAMSKKGFRVTPEEGQGREGAPEYSLQRGC